jgi:hypothetical protein
MKKSIGSILDSVIETSIKQALNDRALEEKEKQVSLQPANKGEPPKADAGGGDQTDFDSMKSEPSATGSDDAESGNQDIKLDNVVDELNTIRSGKSFKDSLVQQRFEQYFNSLSKDERKAMHSFLKGIAGIVTGEVEASHAETPEKSDLTIHKGKDEKTKHIKPNVITKPNIGAPPKKGIEDTSAPVQAKKRGA